MSTDDFQFDALLKNLSCLRTENLIRIPPVDMEWILAQFVLSLGQNLPLNQGKLPLDLRNRKITRFGRRYLPFSVAIDFPSVSDYQIYTLALATACGVLHARLLDIVIDDPSNALPENGYAIPHVYLKFCHLLSILFPANSLFWKEVDRLTKLTSQAGILEKRRHRNPADRYTWEELQEISGGKMALAQINPFALAFLNGTPEKMSTYQKCWKAISLAVIVNDDVLDWQEDYKQGNYTYLLSQILNSSFLATDVVNGHLPTLREVGVSLYASDMVENLFRSVIDSLRLAQEMANSEGCTGLTNLVRETAEWIEERYSDVTRRKINYLLNPSVD
jgi:hypothetical protein